MYTSASSKMIFIIRGANNSQRNPAVFISRYRRCSGFLADNVEWLHALREFEVSRFHPLAKLFAPISGHCEPINLPQLMLTIHLCSFMGFAIDIEDQLKFQIVCARMRMQKITLLANSNIHSSSFGFDPNSHSSGFFCSCCSTRAKTEVSDGALK